MEAKMQNRPHTTYIQHTSSGHMLDTQLWKNVAFNVFTLVSIEKRCLLTVTEMSHINTRTCTHSCTLSFNNCYFCNARLPWLPAVKYDRMKEMKLEETQRVAWNLGHLAPSPFGSAHLYTYHGQGKRDRVID